MSTVCSSDTTSPSRAQIIFKNSGQTQPPPRFTPTHRAPRTGSRCCIHPTRPCTRSSAGWWVSQEVLEIITLNELMACRQSCLYCVLVQSFRQYLSPFVVHTSDTPMGFFNVLIRSSTKSSGGTGELVLCFLTLLGPEGGDRSFLCHHILVLKPVPRKSQDVSH